MHENPTCLGVWKEVFYIKKNVRRILNKIIDFQIIEA